MAIVDKANELFEKYKNNELDVYAFLDKIHEYNNILNFLKSKIHSHGINSISITPYGYHFYFQNGITIFLKHLEKYSAISFILNTGRYEEEEEVLYSLIAEDDVIFDIGANIGWYTLNIAKRFPKSHIYSFEPIHSTFEQLNTNITINGNSNQVSTYKIGFSDNQKQEYMYIPNSESALAGLKHSDINQDCTKEKIMLSTLDLFVKDNNINRLDFIKIDAEGAELSIINGGLYTLKRFLPVILIELYEEWTKLYDYLPENVIYLFSKLGYMCILLKDKKFLEIRNYSTQAHQINEEYNNFFFLHKNKHAHLIEKLLK